MAHSQTPSPKSEQPTQVTHIAVPSHASIQNPSTWMHDGYSPTEIILAAAVLTSISVGAIATIIMAITGLVKALVPAMKPQPIHNIGYLLSVQSVQVRDAQDETTNYPSPHAE